MGRCVEIRKQSQALNGHYYEVTPHDHPKIEILGSQMQPSNPNRDSIPRDHIKLFYISLNQATKKVFFYEDVEAEPIATIDIDGHLQYQSEAAKDRIPRWLMFLCLKKAKDAFLAERFPSNISFQS